MPRTRRISSGRWHFTLACSEPFIFDEHDLSPETYLSRFGRGHGGMLFKLQTWLQAQSYRTSHGIISTNESYRAKAIAAKAEYAAKAFVVRNGPDTRQFNRCQANPSLKKGDGTSPHTSV